MRLDVMKSICALVEVHKAIQQAKIAFHRADEAIASDMRGNEKSALNTEDEPEDRKLPRQFINHVSKILRSPHELTPAMTGNIHSVVDIDASHDQIFDTTTINVRRFKEKLPVRTSMHNLG